MVMSRRVQGIALGVTSVVALGGAVVIGVRTLPHATVGGMDPLAAVLALVALAGGLWAGYLSLRALRWQETNVTDAAQRLVLAVRDAERDARRQLLGGHDRTIDVDFEFRAAPSHNAQFAAPVGHLDQVVGYYQDLRPGRMVITGEPGAGKTVLAVELILGLLENRGPDDPVPVRLSASSWSIQSVEPWLTEHLVDTYRLPRDTAQALVDARMVLPVVDGLDEMDPHPEPGYDSRTARALRALNAYQNDRAKADLVLTCRSGQYEALEAIQVWAEDAARVQIRPVDPGKAHQFIHRRVADPTRWRNVLDAIDNQPGGPLALGLSTPWRLTLAVTVYEQRDPRDGRYLHDPDELTGPTLDDPDAIRDHLLDLFIPAATASTQAGEEPTYAADDVRAWLTVLATYLNRNAATPQTLGGRPLSGTDIVLHELWPLAGTRRPRAMQVAMFAVVWLIATPLLLIQAGIGFAPRQILGAGSAATFVALCAYWTWVTIWPSPSRADFSKLRTRTGRRQLAGGLVFWLVLGLVVGLASGLVLWLVVGLTAGLTSGLVLWLVLGLVVGLAAGLAAALTAGFESPGEVGVKDPRQVTRNDVVISLTIGLAVGLAVGLTSGLVLGLAFGLAGGLVLGLTGGLAYGVAGFRYGALLLCTRKHTTRWLPWRLGTFLNWSYQAGLIRIAGIAYQFRHRELQDYLAQTDHHGGAPTPDDSCQQASASR